MKRLLTTALLALALGALAATAGAAGEDLAKGFENPPDSAKPHTWWHWMNGNITKEGITLDLEAMKRVGVGGAQIFTADCGIPAGPVKFMTPEWREMIKHAASEAARLGIELCVHNCAGWSSSGGPWVTPEHAMQKVVTSEKRVSGPSRFSAELAQPPTTLNFYRDIAVLAFKAPQDEAVNMATYAPKISASIPTVDGAKLMDRTPRTMLKLPLPARGKPQYIQIEFNKPFLARVVKIVSGPGVAEIGGTVQVSADGKKFRNLRPFAFPRTGAGTLNLTLPAAVSERIWRLSFTRASERSKQLAIAEIEISPRQLIENIDVKAGFAPGNVGAPKWTPPVPGMAVARTEIIELTSKMAPDGKLTWDVPAGEWVIQRIGYTPTGKNNHPAPPEGTGPECDKMSRAGLDNHWAGMMKTILDDMGPLKSINNALIDSYEVGGQNWTKEFRAEFQKRRGYDPIPYLPTFTGRIVESPEMTERFLWDVRRTISDLFAENYFAYFAELCHKAGLKASIEPYTGPFESLQVGAPADIPMGEFWSGSSAGSINGSVRLAASVGHIYGRNVIGAESFTASPDNGKWQNDPASFKALGDLVYCLGVNRYIFHRYAHQPWTKWLPGMTMGQWGFHFERTNTWFEQGAAWLKYCARCQYLLQSGVFAADVAYYLGEDAPAEFVSRKSLSPALPDGYDFDGLGKDVLLKHMSVKDGRLVLDTGMSYRVLALPTSGMYTPEVLRKIKELVQAGATVIGPRPVGSPSLQNYPACDGEVEKLAAALWGEKSEKLTLERAVGKGKVIAGKSLEEVFTAMAVKPDFECATPDSKVIYIHRTVGEAEIYFVSNQRQAVQEAQCVFRVSGRTPELWNPETGAIAPAPVWSEKDGRITVPLRFEPAGSIFVVFRQAATGDHAAGFVYEQEQIANVPQVPRPKVVLKKAVFEAVDGEGAIDVTSKSLALMAEGKGSIPATNAFAGKDPAYMHVKRLRVEYEEDGKPKTKTAPENGTLELGESGEIYEMPLYEVAAAPDGKLALTGWLPGKATFTSTADKKTTAVIAGAFAIIVVDNNWEVAFPQGWGAPPKIKLNKLVSWSDYPDPGVKYFSGTATYSTGLQIPENMVAPGKPLAIDLGRVKNLAEVNLNGKNLGVFWKPPFRVDISGVARAGLNNLEVKVTNMWCNRLIGDEQLPDDREWNGKQLKEWPQWFLEGKPRPSAGRFTFTTWHHFDKDSPLYESGLLGPVMLYGGVKTSVELLK